MVANQAYLFLIFTFTGVIIGLLFDIFRILRKSFKTNDIVTYMQDIIFWIITGLILLYTVFTFSNGEIRFYMFIGVFIGCLLYMISFSKYFITINVRIILVIKRILSIIFTPIKILFRFLKKLFNKVIRKLSFPKKEKTTKKIKILEKIKKNFKNKKDFNEKSRNI